MSITEAAASVAARAFFYPSLAWNIARNRLQDTWHWWDEITPNVVLGAIPFYSTLEELKKLGIQAVVTLNETFEVFITTEQYQSSGFRHLHIPTVDFLFAPPTEDLHRGADFIHEIATDGGKTYVHCKAGRGRSTTLVLCYLIKYYGQSPEAAYTFVREKRPQVYLAQGQWTAVCGFYVSCHPEQNLNAEDFPYPILQPLAPGKQGSDGNDTNLDHVDSPASTADMEHGRSLDTSTAEQSICNAWQDSAESLKESGGEKGRGTGGQADSQPSPRGGSLQILGPSTSPQHSDCSQGDETITVSPGALPIDADDVVLLSSVGSTTESRTDSDLSLGSIATALSTCCIHPRSQQSTGSNETQQASAFSPPQRSASPAIQIPRVSSPGPKPVLTPGIPSQSPASKASISLEPSGSLPGYIRIAPAAKVRPPGEREPIIRATLTSTGFTPIDDWADLGFQHLNR